MNQIKFKYDYKTIRDLAVLDIHELLAYKHAMDLQSKNILAESRHWVETYKLLAHRLKDVERCLHRELGKAEDARCFADSSTYDFLCRIH